MKRKVLISLLLLVVVFTITGCFKKEKLEEVNYPSVPEKRDDNTYTCGKLFETKYKRWYVEYSSELNDKGDLKTYTIDRSYDLLKKGDYRNECKAQKVTSDRINKDKSGLEVTVTCEYLKKKVTQKGVYTISKLSDERKKKVQNVLKYQSKDKHFDVEGWKTYLTEKGFTCN